MDISAFVLIAIFTAPLFFVWKWVFRKIAPKSRRIILTWLLTIITAPIGYMLFVLAWILIIEYYPNRDFDKKSWADNRDTRYEYTHHLINSNLLLGKSKTEVLQLLGNDADTTQINELGYDIGFRPELFGIDPSYLIIDFKNGKVDTVIEHDR